MIDDLAAGPLATTLLGCSGTFPEIGYAEIEQYVLEDLVTRVFLHNDNYHTFPRSDRAVVR